MMTGEGVEVVNTKPGTAVQTTPRLCTNKKEKKQMKMKKYDEIILTAVMCVMRVVEIITENIY